MLIVIAVIAVVSSKTLLHLSRQQRIVIIK